MRRDGRIGPMANDMLVTDEVLREVLGMPAERIAALRNQGAIR